MSRRTLTDQLLYGPAKCTFVIALKFLRILKDAKKRTAMAFAVRETNSILEHQLRQLAYDKHVAAVANAKSVIDTSAPPSNPRLAAWRARFAKQQKRLKGDASASPKRTSAQAHSRRGHADVARIENACAVLVNQVYDDGMTVIDASPSKPVLAHKRNQPNITKPVPKAPKLRTPQNSTHALPLLKNLKDEVQSEPAKFERESESELPDSGSRDFDGTPDFDDFDEAEPTEPATPDPFPEFPITEPENESRQEGNNESRQEGNEEADDGNEDAPPEDEDDEAGENEEDDSFGGRAPTERDDYDEQEETATAQDDDGPPSSRFEEADRETPEETEVARPDERPVSSQSVEEENEEQGENDTEHGREATNPREDFEASGGDDPSIPALGEDPPAESEEEDEVDIALALLPKRMNPRNALIVDCEEPEDTEREADPAPEDARPEADDDSAREEPQDGTISGQSQEEAEAEPQADTRINDEADSEPEDEDDTHLSVRSDEEVEPEDTHAAPEDSPDAAHEAVEDGFGLNFDAFDSLL
jgi:hypothetical protein